MAHTFSLSTKEAKAEAQAEAEAEAGKSMSLRPLLVYIMILGQAGLYSEIFFKTNKNFLIFFFPFSFMFHPYRFLDYFSDKIGVLFTYGCMYVNGICVSVRGQLLGVSSLHQSKS